MTNEILEILKILIPPVIVGVVVYILMKKQHEKELKLISILKPKETKAQENSMVASGFNERQIILPLKIQAYERITLFLERIEPSSLVMRIHKPGMSAKLLHADLLKAIREEYDHNVSQQMYVSNNGWNLVVQAKEETVNIINSGLNKVDDSATGIDLSRAIFESMMGMTQSPTNIAVNYIKQEVQQNINI